jgi:hypothetical protein
LDEAAQKLHRRQRHRPPLWVAQMLGGAREVELAPVGRAA